MQGNGYVYWNELMTGDIEASKAFYEKTVGWTFSSMPMSEGTYWVFSPPGSEQPAGGMMQFDQGPTNTWFTYVQIDDLDGALAKVAAAGGTIQRQPFEIEGVGRIAIVTDATGATLGWITPVSPPTT
ncbi:MAG TPA: VOC family protein [Methylomirabilota bacterium]|nr:VOC family protein [Methylomirabilota bacterium]